MHRRPARYRRLAITLFWVGVATWLVHEACHWLAGTLLGYPMQATLNRAWSATPMTTAHAMVVSMAGPMATYAQAVVGMVMVRSRASMTGFAMVYLAFFMRLVAMAVSVFNPNDEARVSLELGIGQWTLPSIVVALLLALTVSASRRMKVTAREHFACYLVASLVSALFVGADMVLFPATPRV